MVDKTILSCVLITIHTLHNTYIYNCSFLKRNNLNLYMSLRLPLLLFTILVYNVLFSQNYSQDSLNNVSVFNGINYYKEKLGGFVFINNGVEYTASFPKSSGHPFLDNSFYNGFLTFNGIWYIDVPLKFDLVNQELVIMNKKSLLSIIDKSKVESFEINRRNFVHLSKEKYPFVSDYGFYELLYQNDISVYAKRSKFVQPATKVDELNSFSQVNRYFIIKDQNFHAIKRERDLLKIFDTKRTEIKEVLFTKKIKFKHNPEQVILAVVDYYLHNQQ
jgi:hypothetical protein